MRRAITLLSFLLVAALAPNDAEACGGFFCSATPVDQSAERVLFEVDAGRVRATVQITYAGAPEDFAWVLPTPGVATVEDVFPQRALSGIDIATEPRYEVGWCLFPEMDAAAGGGDDGGGEGGEEDDGVIVHERKEVGPFETAVVESDDPQALVVWLRENGYRITEAMIPYVSTYVTEGMVFVALKMKPDAQTADIAPIIFSWPGDRPVVPLRLTAVAAEPEMGVVVWVLGDRRYESDNFQALEVDDDALEIDQNRIWSANPTNYHQHVARLVDAVHGKGFVTEFAGSTDALREMAGNMPTPDEEAEEAKAAFVELMGKHDYITRMYTRLSPEEMAADPSFVPSPQGAGDVSNIHDLSERFQDDENGCNMDMLEAGGAANPNGPCAFVACGANGFCELDEQGRAGCACRAGFVARTVREGDQDAVTCQDEALAFPDDGGGDGGPAFFDPCAGFDCGVGGACVNMNGTPTCKCEQGLLAVGQFVPLADEPQMRQRKTWCVASAKPIPDAFYAGEVVGPGDDGAVDGGTDGGGADGGGAGAGGADAGGADAGGDDGGAAAGGEDGGGPGGVGGADGGGATGGGGGGRSQDGGLCAVSPGAAAGGLGLLPALLTILGLAWVRRS